MKKSRAFGLEQDFADAKVVLIPVPWEVTVSYGGGTSLAAGLIREASMQLDFFSKFFSKSYAEYIYLDTGSEELLNLNLKSRKQAEKVMQAHPHASKEDIQACTQACEQMLDIVYKRCQQVSEQGKFPSIIGGDHSVSLAPVRFICEKYQGDIGLLHVDAHADLRQAYQGLKHSHASVMYNILNLPQAPKKLLQVGVRDFCEEEHARILKDDRISCYFDEDLQASMLEGETWSRLCRKMIKELPDKIYVSLDVDGLEWSLAPGTGTPVPGGLSFAQITYLLQEIKRQEKTLVGFDVVEVSAGLGLKQQVFGEWTGNVAARLIYLLSGLAIQA